MGRDASQTVSTLLGRKNREKSNRFIHKYISKRIYLQFHYYFQSNLFFSFYPSTFLFERSKRKIYNIHKFAAKRNKIFKFSPTPIHRRTLLINYSNAIVRKRSVSYPSLPKPNRERDIPKSFRLRFFNREFVQPITILGAKASIPPPPRVPRHLSSLLVHFSRASPCWYATPRRQLTPFDSARLFVIESSAASYPTRLPD